MALLFRPQAPGPQGLWRLWGEGGVRLCVSTAVLDEIRSTLGRLPVGSDRKQAILDRLEDRAFTDHVDPIPDSGYRCADRTDDKFLHLAVAAGADALITSDRALLDVADFPLPVTKIGVWLRGPAAP